MKHVKLFEQFISESDDKVKAARAKLNTALDKVIAQMQEIYDEKDQLENMEDGDPDKIEFRLNDLDGYIMDLESQRDEIKAKIKALQGK
jgi:DNA repair exonuclease SbcCD ATPase subunit